MRTILMLAGAWFLGCFALLCAYGLGLELHRAYRRRQIRRGLRKVFNNREWP